MAGILLRSGCDSGARKGFKRMIRGSVLTRRYFQKHRGYSRKGFALVIEQQHERTTWRTGLGDSTELGQGEWMDRDIEDMAKACKGKKERS